ncbi:hypothetical protein AVEN_259876-1, partial [Araneus ventricosus]
LFETPLPIWFLCGGKNLREDPEGGVSSSVPQGVEELRQKIGAPLSLRLELVESFPLGFVSAAPVRNVNDEVCERQKCEVGFSLRK